MVSHHFSFCLFRSSVALSLFFADFCPPAWRDQFAGASSCWTGSMHRGIWNRQPPPKESDKGELHLLHLQVWKVFQVFNIRLQWKASTRHVSTATFAGVVQRKSSSVIMEIILFQTVTHVWLCRGIRWMMKREKRWSMMHRFEPHSLKCSFLIKSCIPVTPVSLIKSDNLN